MIWPVMNDALREATNTMASAISAGLPARLRGTPATSPAFLSAVPVNRFSSSVSTGPGAIALTRMPDAAPSSAADFVNPSTACLLAVYRDAPAAPRCPMVDDRFTMLPLPCACITHFMLHAQQHTEHVGIEGGCVALGCLLRHRTGLAFGAGIVDRHIEPTEPSYGLVDQVADVVLVPNVRADELSFKADTA